jgi:hypothetical protein
MPSKWHICKEGLAGNKIDNCFCFLNYRVFLRPAVVRAVSILPWIVSPGRSYRFLWAGSSIQRNVRKDKPTPAYSPVSDRRRLTVLFTQFKTNYWCESSHICRCECHIRLSHHIRRHPFKWIGCQLFVCALIIVPLCAANARNALRPRPFAVSDTRVFIGEDQYMHESARVERIYCRGQKLLELLIGTVPLRARQLLFLSCSPRASIIIPGY